MPIEAKSPAVGAAGDNSYLSNLPASNTENLGSWQPLGDVAARVVADLPARREAWLVRRFNLSPAAAHVVEPLAFTREAAR